MILVDALSLLCFLVYARAPEFDMSELESLFSAAVPSADNGNKSNRLTGRKSEKVQLVSI